MTHSEKPLKPFELIELEYDVRRGYATQYRDARAAFVRPSSVGETDLNGNAGFIRMNVFSRTECAEIRDKIDADLAAGIYDRKYLAALLVRTVTPEIDREIVSYFETEYAPINSGFDRTAPDDRTRYSDGWHCDAGPAKFLRIMAYFTSSAECGGKTLFSDRATTDAMHRAGYVFCDLGSRVQDLNPLTDSLGLPRAAVVDLEIEAGDVVIFDASKLLHRRLLPENGPRYLMNTTLIPSMVPMRTILGAGQLPLPLDAQTFPLLHGYAREDMAPVIQETVQIL